MGFVGDHRFPHLKGKKGEYRRRGRVFTLRLTPEDETALRNAMEDSDDIRPWSLYYRGRRDSLGPFIVWAALRFDAERERARLAEPPTPEPPGARVIPKRRRLGNTRAPGGSLANRIGR